MPICFRFGFQDFQKGVLLNAGGHLFFGTDAAFFGGEKGEPSIPKQLTPSMIERLQWNEKENEFKAEFEESAANQRDVFLH